MNLVFRAWFAVNAHNVPISGEDDVTVFLWTVNVVWIEGLIWGPFIVIDGVFVYDLENVLSFQDGEDAVDRNQLSLLEGRAQDET